MNSREAQNMRGGLNYGKKFLHKWGSWIIDKENCTATRTCTKADCNFCKEQVEKHDFSAMRLPENNVCMCSHLPTATYFLMSLNLLR